MALIWSVPAAAPAPPPETQSGSFSWDAWYAKNKIRLSEKRAKRYREDPEYREAALRRSREQRQKSKTPVVDGATVPFKAMADALGVTPWVLREWRRKDYFPEPSHRDGRLWFKPEHEVLLQRLVAFFAEHGPRVDATARELLGPVTAYVFANW